MPVLGRLRGVGVRSRYRAARERRRRVPWPAVAGSQTGGRVAIVVVNYETRLLVSQLVFSLYRILGADRFALTVVVDNGSRDGSAEMLAALHRAGLVHLIRNRRQRYHGPGVNQAISWLARRQSAVPREDRIDYVWVLDSDVVVLRRDTVHDAVGMLRATGAALIGEEFEGRPPGYAPLAPHSLMLDPVQLWHRRLPAFAADGPPEQPLQHALAAAGLGAETFPFLHHSYVLHLGSATLHHVARSGMRDNRFYESRFERHRFHYNHHPLGPRLHGAVLELYDREVRDDTPDALVAACAGGDLFTIPDARPLPPLAELRALHARGVDLVEYLDARPAP